MLRIIFRFVLLLHGVLALPSGHARRANPSVGKAIYFQTNDQENAVIALSIGSNGRLSGGRRSPTGGLGSSIATNGTTAQSRAPSALGSAGSVAVAGNFVFAVNAGSNTLSMLQASADDPTQLRFVSITAQLPGEFPVTVAASATKSLACVGFSGARAGVCCIPFTASGFGKVGVLHAFKLGQTTPPDANLDLVSQTSFSLDGNNLYTSVRGPTGFFSALALETIGSRRKGQDTHSLVNFNGSLFGSLAVPNTDLVFAADPTVGGQILIIDSGSQKATLEKPFVIPGQVASSWITFDPSTRNVIITDAGTDRIAAVQIEDGSVQKITNLRNGNPGQSDVALAGQFVYALFAGNDRAGPSVAVIDTQRKLTTLNPVQKFVIPSSLSVGPSAVGMAVM